MTENPRNMAYYFPTPMAGFALGIASLCWLWDTVTGLGGVLKLFGALAALVIIVGMTVRFIRPNSELKEDLSDPVVGASLPGISMALMVISHELGTFSPMLGRGLWLAAILLHYSLLLALLLCQWRKLTINCVNPGWFVPFVGVVTAAVSYPGGYPVLVDSILVWGLVSYAILVPLMMYRLIWGESVEGRAMPSVAILAAPGSLSLAGYLTVMAEPSPMVLSLLFGISTLMTMTVYASLFKLLRLPFSPGFAAYTFPTVISASALFKLSTWLEGQSINQEYTLAIRSYAQVELLLATAIVLFVGVQFYRHYLKSSA